MLFILSIEGAINLLIVNWIWGLSKNVFLTKCIVLFVSKLRNLLSNLNLTIFLD